MAMQNTILFLFFVALNPSTAQTQEQKYSLKDTVPIGKVIYSHQVHLSGASNKNGIAELFFNTNRSLYIHRGDPNEKGNLYPDLDGVMVKAVGGDKQGAPIYKMHAERILLYRDQCVAEKNRCIVSDTLGGIAWILHPEHKRLGQYDCRRATGVFHGREYEAWYTLDIPIPSGPFKLGGLPGLILEARTTDGAADFLFVSIEFSKNIPDKIKPPFGKDSGLNYAQHRKATLEFLQSYLNEMRAKGIDVWTTSNPNALELWEPEK